MIHHSHLAALQFKKKKKKMLKTNSSKYTLKSSFFFTISSTQNTYFSHVVSLNSPYSETSVYNDSFFR